MLTADQIKQNWDTFISNINTYISSPRKEQLLDFYKKYEDRIVLMPASHKPQYHNCFPGGYVDHVNRVVNCALQLDAVWGKMGADMTTFTQEELVFSAINHDLGKFGSEEQEAYIEQKDQWRRDKLGEVYEYNNKIEFMSVPDRSLYLLLSNKIEFSKNEMLAIKLHDGVYDEANKPYLVNWLPEQKPRTSLIFILHHADMMASRIEFEKEWLPKFKNENKKDVKSDTRPLADIAGALPMKQTKGEARKTKALEQTIGNDVLDKFFKK